MGKIRNTRWNTHPRNTQYPEKYMKQSPGPKYLYYSPYLVERQDLWYKVNSTIPFTGTQKRYHLNDQLQSRRILKKGKQHGLYESYFKNGQLEEKGNYKNGKKNGLWECYYENGQLEEKGNYKNGKKNGIWERYKEKYYINKGQLSEKRNYKEGKLDFKERYREDGSIIKDKSGCGGCLGVLIGLGIIILLLNNV